MPISKVLEKLREAIKKQNNGGNPYFLNWDKVEEFLITTLKEAMEEVKPKKKDRLTYYKENGKWFDENKVDGWNAYGKELQQNINHYFEN